MIIAIDYGEKNCGLAVSYEGLIAEPLESVKTEKIFKKLIDLQPEEVVVGVSENFSAQKAREFAKGLQNMLPCPVVTVDETLTSVEAEKLSQDKGRQHAVAAALILERYLDLRS